MSVRRRSTPVWSSLLSAAVLAGVLGLAAGPAQAGTPARPDGPGATVRVGAAIASITPPAFGALRNDPANCIAGTPAASVFTGRRQFAFEDPYIDVNHVGHYSLGDPYVDCAHVGRWVGNLLGGGANAPRFYDHVADRITARAMVVSNGERTMAVEVVDNEGLFNIYAARIRAAVAAAGVHLYAINISSTHDESAPDTIGLGGVNPVTSGVNPFYADFLVSQAASAIVAADHAMRPARIRLVEALEPANLRQCWSSYPYVDDQIMPTLQAVGTNGHVIATLTSVSQHAESLGFDPGPSSDWISADWPGFFRRAIQRRFGGVAIEMAGSVGSVETPEVFTAPISRVPQRFDSANHPAGCDTIFKAAGHQVPIGYDTETRALGQDLAGAVISALEQHATWSRSTVLWNATTPVCVKLTNDEFIAAGAAGVFGGRPIYLPGCAVQAPLAPNDSGVGGNSIRTQVGAFQIGDAGFLTLPGEVFPYTYLRGFLGPEDMPFPNYPLPPWPMPYLRTPYRFFVGLANDMIGYIFPEGNGVGVPGEHPVRNPTFSSTDRFGCGHADDSESTGSNTSNVLGAALVGLLRAHYGPPESITDGRYVLGDGVLSRDPLGTPASLKCNVDQVFHPAPPAVAVWLPGGRIVHPIAWMSLSGRAQSHPDRNTRGYLTAGGVHHWLNVYPDIAGAPARVNLAALSPATTPQASGPARGGASVPASPVAARGVLAFTGDTPALPATAGGLVLAGLTGALGLRRVHSRGGTRGVRLRPRWRAAWSVARTCRRARR